MAKTPALPRKWDPLTGPVALRELVTHAVLVAVGWHSGLGYLGLMAIVAAELLLMALLSIPLYPERGVGRHVVSLLLFMVMLAVVGGGISITYATAMHADPGFAARAPAAVVRLDRDLLQWSLAYTAIHLLAMLLYARTRPDPRAAWSAQVLMQGSATLLAAIPMIGLTLLAGPPLILAALNTWPGSAVAADNALILLFALIRLAAALLLSKMPAADRADVARNPYAN